MKTVKEKQNILIVSGGSLEDAFVLEQIANNHYQYTIACDSGTAFFYRNGLRPDLILGDFDSADQAVLDAYKSRDDVAVEQYPAEKDWTDTELALHRALEFAPGRIDLLGGTGSRLDHVLLTLGLEAGVEIFMLDAHNRIRMIDRDLRILKSEQYGDYISLIPHGGDVCGLTLRGMKYPLERATLTTDVSLGVSNEIVEDEAWISFSAGRLLVLETRD